jgi:hypothetical protein
MTDHAKHTRAAIEAHYQFLLWLAPAVEKFPRGQKFTLGDRIQTTALDVLEALIEAIYTKERAQRRNLLRDRAQLRCFAQHDFAADELSRCAKAHTVKPCVGDRRTFAASPRTSGSGPGCVKTWTSAECAEWFSLLPSPDRGRWRHWFLNRRNGDELSTQKLNVGVFTQPGS